jgi:hypothetical protein
MKKILFAFSLIFCFSATEAQRNFELVKATDSTFVINTTDVLDNGYTQTTYYPESGTLDSTEAVQYLFRQAAKMLRIYSVQSTRAELSEIEGRRLAVRGNTLIDSSYFDYTKQKFKTDFIGKYRSRSADSTFAFEIYETPNGVLRVQTENRNFGIARLWSDREMEILNIPELSENVRFNLLRVVNNIWIYNGYKANGDAVTIYRIPKR